MNETKTNTPSGEIHLALTVNKLTCYINNYLKFTLCAVFSIV